MAEPSDMANPQADIVPNLGAAMLRPYKEAVIAAPADFWNEGHPSARKIGAGS
jgi:hypothetical protein